MHRILVFCLTVGVTIMASGAPGVFRPDKILTPTRAEGVDSPPRLNAEGDQEPGAIVERGHEAMREYEIGYKLGQCLLAEGCQVFIGTISSLGEPEAEAGVDPDKAVIYKKIYLTLDEWVLSNKTKNKADLELTSASRPKLTKTASGPWTAWETADLRVGGKVLIALWGEKAQRPKWGTTPENVAVAISNTESFTPVREIIRTHRQYEMSPDEFNGVSQVIDTNYSNLLLGYVMAYLKTREEIRDVDNAALVFGRLLNNNRIPGPVRGDISFQILGDYYRLSDKTRGVITESLVAAAVSDDAHVAESTINVLIRLGDDKQLDMRPSLTPERRRKLIENYYKFNSKGSSEKEHAEFKSQLGLR